MQITVKSRAAEGVANPYAEREGESRKRGKAVTVAFLALVSYWALLFAPKAEENLPRKERVEPEAAPESAGAPVVADLSLPEPVVPEASNSDAVAAVAQGSAPGPQLAEATVQQSGPISASGRATAGVEIATGPALPRGEPVGPVPQAGTAAPFAETQSGPGFATSPTGSGPAIATPVVVATPAQPTVTLPPEGVPPFEVVPEIYDLTDLLADLRVRTAALSGDAVGNLVTFAVNDVLSETALRRLQTGEADLALGRFETEAQAFAELLTTPATQQPSPARSDMSATDPDLASLLANVEQTDVAPPFVADLFQSATTSF